MRKVTQKDDRCKKKKKKREKSYKRHYETCYFSGTTLPIFWDLSVTYTSFSKITQTAQRYKYCVLLLCTHAVKKKAFLLQTENQLV